MKQRLPNVALLVATLLAWWTADHVLGPWFWRVSGYHDIQNRALSVILGHWVFDQLPRVLLCVGIWLAGSRLGLMPSLRASLGMGLSRRRVIVTGLVSTAILIVATFAVGKAAGGKFGFFPYVPKMAGDLVSNMYEEIVYRGLMFSAFYGVVAATSFPLSGPTSRAGVIVATVGSCAVFAAGHDQYPVELRVVLGVLSIVFVYAWVRARSLWAPWIPHTLVDFIVDSTMKL